jgi:hypothetical protein
MASKQCLQKSSKNAFLEPKQQLKLTDGSV